MAEYSRENSLNKGGKDLASIFRKAKAQGKTGKRNWEGKLGLNFERPGMLRI